jgi:hypothetical protein
MKMFFVAALLVAGPVAAQTAPPTLAKIPAGPGAPAKAKPVVAPGEISRSAPVNGVLTLFGNERCPINANGEEIVICVRRSAQEQYRVPKELREFVVTPENASWATKAQGTLDAGVGVSSIGSCSAVGPGGASGCFNQRVKESRLENKTRAAEVPVLP